MILVIQIVFVFAMRRYSWPDIGVFKSVVEIHLESTRRNVTQSKNFLEIWISAKTVFNWNIIVKWSRGDLRNDTASTKFLHQMKIPIIPFKVAPLSPTKYFHIIWLEYWDNGKVAIMVLWVVDISYMKYLPLKTYEIAPAGDYFL